MSNAVLQAVYSGLIWIYTLGYSIYLAVAGWTSWGSMTFWDWCTHISWESVYALAWPVLVTMSWLGYR
jgi:hypothetical protein